MGIRHLPYTTRSNILFALLLTLASPVTPLVLQNITIALPPGSSDHGTPGLLCTPTKPIDLLTFYLLNYVAHAATVLTRPGERADDYFVSVIGSLLFPALGLYRGIEAILSGAVCVRDDDLRKAARSGALCVVVRGADWRPVDGEIITHAIYKRPADTKGLQETRRTFTGETLTEEAKENAVHVIPYFPPYIFTRFGLPVFVHRRIIHGTHTLPPGYRFAILPHDAQFASPSTDQPTIEVSATYNIVKALIALVQSVYALTTLYRARGDQISQFGYAAFGLTVAPYAVMSITNLIGNLCRPEYPSLYMVESSIMDEARKRGGLFEAAGVRVQEDERLHVCNCGFANGEELDDLHFAANEDGEVEAHFSTTDPLAYVKQREVEQNTEKTLTASTLETKFPLPARSLLLPQTHALAPTPKKLNYINTQNNALLLIPCHTPLIRFTPPTSSSIIETPHPAPSSPPFPAPHPPLFTPLHLDPPLSPLAHLHHRPAMALDKIHFHNLHCLTPFTHIRHLVQLLCWYNPSRRIDELARIHGAVVEFRRVYGVVIRVGSGVEGCDDEWRSAGRTVGEGGYVFR
ncbi:uncharacterized protein ALTATR162_LOCUS139 [Alternaria atra]|uniref:Uncharacterized protein n=1 Tax=Alternaria atra TaxID=119953 RepID=A0A8J2HUV4_9PLEO|nr:uncharacterized protein ALTATR162_LOCUS139 [Alternaria atra]CAG5137535.1 unnamed protein product [Alternaria atra]